jgi:DNA polymerase-3 subunit delta'
VFPLGNVKGDKDEDRFRAEILKTWRAFLLEQPFGNLNDWVNYYGGEDKQVNISREESREIIRNLSLKPFESRFKIMIIWQPEIMHPSAANGILKILEEPPPFTIFLLVSQQAKQLLPTIVSRTQSIFVPLLSDRELEAFLKKQDGDDNRRRKVVQLAEGNLNLALTLLDNEEDNNFEVFGEWMRACHQKDYTKLIGISETFHEWDKLSQRNLMRYSLTMMRESVLQLAGAEEITKSAGAELKFIQDFSRVMDISKIEKVNRWITESEYFLDRNGSAKMIFMDLSLRISKIIK